MDMNKNKALRRMIQCFSLFLALRVIEELIIIPRFNTMGLISCLGGLIVLLIYVRFINKPLDEIGMLFSGHKVAKGILISVLLNVIPAVSVYYAEYRTLMADGGYARVTIFYEQASRSYSAAGMRTFLLWTLAGLLIGIVNALFYEISFRGLLITLGSRSLHFSAINWIQTGLYTVWYLIPVVRIAIYNLGDEITVKRLLILLGVTLCYEMITGLKLGLLRFSTGAVWVCIFDHIVFAFILDMVHMQYTDLAGTVYLDSRYYFRILAYQAVAFVITFIYYSYKKKKILAIQQEQQMEQCV